MGSRGPQGTPTQLRIVRGDRKDRINDQEPIPSEGEVSPPGWLSEQALEVWHRYAPDLIRKKVLTAWDVEAFANFCDAVARRRRASKMLDEQGEVLELPVYNKNGDLTGHRLGKNPWELVWKDADAQAQRWGARFGMSPSERSQITVEAPRGSKGGDLLSS